MAKFMDYFDLVERERAQKMVDFFEGKSEKYLQKFLDAHRINAQTMGARARTRNMVRPIVEKSGMLFAGKAPQLKVYSKATGEIDDVASEACLKAFEDAEWVEYFNNFDSLVRMLKTELTYVQILEDEEIDGSTKKRFFFTALGQNNCGAHFNSIGKVDVIVFFIGREENNDVYKVVTKELFQELVVVDGGTEYTRNVEPNPYGFIPQAIFHDTNTPLKPGWNPVPVDLTAMNDMFNVHMTDSEYAGMWGKMKTLYTNAETGDDVGGTPYARMDAGMGKLGPRIHSGSTAPGFVGGPGAVVGIANNSGETPYVEFKGPEADQSGFDQIMRGWNRDYAADWSVRYSTDETAGVESGFALVVKELPNAELRKKRQRMMEAGFHRLYEVMLGMSAKFDMGLVQDTELFVEFSAPELPIDEAASEAIWDRKIKSGRSSDVEYYMVTYGLSREEAQQKAKQIAEDRAFVAGLGAPPVEDTGNRTTTVVI